MAPARKRLFHTASDADIKRGEVSDVYFQRTVEILAARGDRKRVKAEVYLKSLPEDWHWGVLAGIEEVAGLLEGLPVDVVGDGRGHPLRAVPAGLADRRHVRRVGPVRDGAARAALPGLRHRHQGGALQEGGGRAAGHLVRRAAHAPRRWRP